MQLFILDKDPGVAVQYLADCHVVKMCLETAQILSALLMIEGHSLLPGLPKPQNLTHPVIRAIDTNNKKLFVALYNYKLQLEYTHRFNKTHAYRYLVPYYREILCKDNTSYDCSGLAAVFKDFTTDKEDLIQAHRDYYRHKKQLINKWKYTKRKEPAWLL